LNVNLLSAAFAAANKNYGKKSLLPSKNRHYVSDLNKNEHTSRRHAVVFCSGNEIYDNTPNATVGYQC